MDSAPNANGFGRRQVAWGEEGRHRGRCRSSIPLDQIGRFLVQSRSASIGAYRRMAGNLWAASRFRSTKSNGTRTNARLCDGRAISLTMIVGWAGHGKSRYGAENTMSSTWTHYCQRMTRVKDVGLLCLQRLPNGNIRDALSFSGAPACWRLLQKKGLAHYGRLKPYDIMT